MFEYTPEIFDLEVGGNTYTVEFNREALKEADSMGLLVDSHMGVYDRTAVALYAGMKKNNPFITPKQAQRILDKALDEGYSLNSFADILEEFGRAYKAVFMQSEETKKVISRRSAPAKI